MYVWLLADQRRPTTPETGSKTSLLSWSMTDHFRQKLIAQWWGRENRWWYHENDSQETASSHNSYTDGISTLFQTPATVPFGPDKRHKCVIYSVYTEKMASMAKWSNDQVAWIGPLRILLPYSPLDNAFRKNVIAEKGIIRGLQGFLQLFSGPKSILYRNEKNIYVRVGKIYTVKM